MYHLHIKQQRMIIRYNGVFPSSNSCSGDITILLRRTCACFKHEEKTNEYVLFPVPAIIQAFTFAAALWAGELNTHTPMAGSGMLGVGGATEG